MDNEHISDLQAEYIRNHRRHHHMVAFLRFLAFFLFLVLWEISTNLHWIDAFIFSSPSRILTTVLDMSKDGSIFRHTGITLFETLLSFVLVLLVSFLTATVLWFSDTVSEILEPWLVILNSLPKSALAPLLIVWLGANTRTIIVAGMSVAVFGSIISMYTAFRSTDEAKIKLIYTLGGSRMQVLKNVVIPSSLPSIISESQDWTMPGGGNHRRIPGCKRRTWLSDHLCKSDFQTKLSDHCSDHPVSDCLLPLPGHTETGTPYPQSPQSLTRNLFLIKQAHRHMTMRLFCQSADWTAFFIACAITSAASVPAILISASTVPMETP